MQEFGGFELRNLVLVGLIIVRPRDQTSVDSCLEQKQQ